LARRYESAFVQEVVFMIETIIVILLVAVAGVFTVRRITPRAAPPKSGNTGCGACSGCSSAGKENSPRFAPSPERSQSPGSDTGQG